MKWPVSLLALARLMVARASVSQEVSSAPESRKAAIVEVRKIWDRAPHSMLPETARPASRS